MQGIDLFEANEGTTITPAIFFTIGLKVVIDFATTENEAFNLGRISGSRPFQNFMGKILR